MPSDIPIMYLRFSRLSENDYIPGKRGIKRRRVPRYDLVATFGNWLGVPSVSGGGNATSLHLISRCNGHRENVPGRFLQCRSFHLTGLRFMSGTVAVGEPPLSYRMKDGGINPLYFSRNDAFLFFFSRQEHIMEMLVFAGGRNFINGYGARFMRGGYNGYLMNAREHALPYV